MFDCVVILVSDFDVRFSYPKEAGAQPLVATAPIWMPRLRGDLAALKRTLDAAGTPSLFVAVPLASELGTTEAAAAQIVPNAGLPADDVVLPDGTLEQLATAPFASAKLNWLNGWAVFERDIRSPDHRPLYLSLDGHLTPYGNQVLGDAIAVRLEADRPWLSIERHP
jgi:hypothetical protein